MWESLVSSMPKIIQLVTVVIGFFLVYWTIKLALEIRLNSRDHMEADVHMMRTFIDIIKVAENRERTSAKGANADQVAAIKTIYVLSKKYSNLRPIGIEALSILLEEGITGVGGVRIPIEQYIQQLKK